MTLDVNTLFLVTIYVEVILGLLLLFAWVQNTAITAVAWWGFAHLLRAASVVLFGMYGSAPDLITIDLANALLFTAFALTWTGARVFDHLPAAANPDVRRRRAVADRLPSAGGRRRRSSVRVLFSPASSPPTPGPRLTNSGAGAANRWCRAGRRSSCCLRMARFFCCARRSAPCCRGRRLATRFSSSVWLTVLSFEALLFTISIAFILLAMAKERTEHRHKTAALVDPLTGIANRRAFLQDGETQLQTPGGQSASDRGDAARSRQFQVDQRSFRPRARRPRAGDFRRIGSALMRRIDLFGRLGGEEFAAICSTPARDRALGRRRRDPRGLCRGNPRSGGPLRSCATVSIGIVIATTRCSIFRRCSRRPITRSIAPRTTAATASNLLRSISCLTVSSARRRASGRARRQRHGQIRGLSRVT